MKLFLSAVFHRVWMMARSILKFNPCLRTPDLNFIADHRMSFTAPSSAYARIVEILETAPEFRALMRELRSPHLLRIACIGGDRLRINFHLTEPMSFPGLPVQEDPRTANIFHLLYDAKGGLRRLATAYDARWTYNPYEVEYSFEYALEPEDIIFLHHLTNKFNPENHHVQVA